MNVLVDLGHTTALRSPDREVLTLARTVAAGDPVSVLTHAPDAAGLAQELGGFDVAVLLTPQGEAPDLSKPIRTAAGGA